MNVLLLFGWLNISNYGCYKQCIICLLWREAKDLKPILETLAAVTNVTSWLEHSFFLIFSPHLLQFFN